MIANSRRLGIIAAGGGRSRHRSIGWHGPGGGGSRRRRDRSAVEQRPRGVTGLKWDGQPVIDATNAWNADLGGRTSSETLADLVPGASR